MECGGSGWHRGPGSLDPKRIALRRFLGHCDHFSFLFYVRSSEMPRWTWMFFTLAMSWNLWVLSIMQMDRHTIGEDFIDD